MLKSSNCLKPRRWDFGFIKASSASITLLQATKKKMTFRKIRFLNGRCCHEPNLLPFDIHIDIFYVRDISIVWCVYWPGWRGHTRLWSSWLWCCCHDSFQSVQSIQMSTNRYMPLQIKTIHGEVLLTVWKLETAEFLATAACSNNSL